MTTRPQCTNWWVVSKTTLSSMLLSHSSSKASWLKILLWTFLISTWTKLPNTKRLSKVKSSSKDRKSVRELEEIMAESARFNQEIILMVNFNSRGHNQARFKAVSKDLERMWSHSHRQIFQRSTVRIRDLRLQLSIGLRCVQPTTILRMKFSQDNMVSKTTKSTSSNSIRK